MITIAVAAALTFNLVCTGTEYSGSLADYQLTPTWTSQKPFSTVYRVDLNNGRWCEDNCKSSQPIFLITSTRIIFDHEAGAIAERDHFVDRETALLHKRIKIASALYLKRGECKKQAFTGLPSVAF